MIRNNTVCWLNPEENTSWIYEKISNFVKEINFRKYRFNIETLQTIQLAEYKASVEGNEEFYRPHIDICMHSAADEQRKLSISIQLTRPDQYVGGDLLFMGDENDRLLSQETFENHLLQRRGLGAAIVFPSFLGHEITPVTKGTRHSLVAWMQGPNWK
jgi:PKHD-type hydroxylase